MLTPVDIQNYSLKTSVRGYSKKETDDFLEAILEGYEALYKENHEIKEKITSLSEGIQYYKQMENSMQKALVLAEKTSNEAQEAAKSTADALTNEAQSKAEELTGQAQEKADAMTDQAQSQANSLLVEAQAKADAVISRAQAFSAEAKVQADTIIAKAQEEAGAIGAKAQTLLADSKAQADALVNNAQVQANAITSQAQVFLAESKAKADALVGDAQKKASDIVGAAQTRAESTEENAKRALREARSYVRDMMKDYESYRVQVKKLVDVQDKLLSRGSVSSLVSDLNEMLQYTTQVDQIPEKEEEPQDSALFAGQSLESASALADNTPVGQQDAGLRFAGGHPPLGQADVQTESGAMQPRFAGGHPQFGDTLSGSGESFGSLETEGTGLRFAGGHSMPEPVRETQTGALQSGGRNAELQPAGSQFAQAGFGGMAPSQPEAAQLNRNGQDAVPSPGSGLPQADQTGQAFADTVQQKEPVQSEGTKLQAQAPQFVQSEPMAFTQPDGVHFGNIEEELKSEALKEKAEEKDIQETLRQAETPQFVQPEPMAFTQPDGIHFGNIEEEFKKTEAQEEKSQGKDIQETLLQAETPQFVQSEQIQFAQPAGIPFENKDQELSVPPQAKSETVYGNEDHVVQTQEKDTAALSHPKDEQIATPELDASARPLLKPTVGFVSPDEVVLRPRFTEDEPKEDEADSLINARMEGYAKSDAESPFTFIDTGK